MKKIIFAAILGLIFFSSCSKEDEDNDSNSNNNGTDSSINPPSWIIGTWTVEDSSRGAGVKFTTDDFCTVITNYSDCNKTKLELIPNSQVTERTTSTSYYLMLDFGTFQTEYEFEKISENEIKDVILSSSFDIDYTYYKY